MLSSRGCQDDKKCQERSLRDIHQLFISVPKNRVVRLNNVPASGRSDALVELIAARQAHGWAPCVLVQILRVDLQMVVKLVSTQSKS
jgi:hypothetical protein